MTENLKVPQRTVADAYTLPDLLARGANRDPDADVLVFPDGRTTFEQQYLRCVEAARSLRGLGVEAGDHVGILMSNCPRVRRPLIGLTTAGRMAGPHQLPGTSPKNSDM